VPILPIWELQVKRKLLNAALTYGPSPIRRVVDWREVGVRAAARLKSPGFSPAKCILHRLWSILPAILGT
jgi:hypothetical protein